MVRLSWLALVTQPKRGDTYLVLVKFNPMIGAEVRKTCPAVVSRIDIANKSSHHCCRHQF